MATIKDVARRAGVSVGSVSNVLSGAAAVKGPLRERVEQAIKDLDFHPNHAARSLKSRRTHTLGMVISDITNPFFPLLVRGAEDAALKRGYLLNIFNTDDHVEREQSIFAVLRARCADGVLAVVAPSTGPPAHLQETMGQEYRWSAWIAFHRGYRWIPSSSITCEARSSASAISSPWGTAGSASFPVPPTFRLRETVSAVTAKGCPKRVFPSTRHSFGRVISAWKADTGWRRIFASAARARLPSSSRMGRWEWER